MPERALANLRIEQLEALFDEKRSNPDVLTTLLGELSHRTTPRARRLRQRVIGALSVGTPPDRQPARRRNPPDAFEPAVDEAALFMLSPDQHRRIAEIYRRGGPDWTDEERAYAAKLAEHHEKVAQGIERRIGRRPADRK